MAAFYDGLPGVSVQGCPPSLSCVQYLQLISVWGFVVSKYDRGLTHQFHQSAGRSGLPYLLL